MIPEGEYGGGPMIVWDTGTWAPMDDVEKSSATARFKFRLAGEKLSGGWMLDAAEAEGRRAQATTGCCSRSATSSPTGEARHPRASGRRA